MCHQLEEGVPHIVIVSSVQQHVWRFWYKLPVSSPSSGEWSVSQVVVVFSAELTHLTFLIHVVCFSSKQCSGVECCVTGCGCVCICTSVCVTGCSCLHICMSVVSQVVAVFSVELTCLTSRIHGSAELSALDLHHPCLHFCTPNSSSSYMYNRVCVILCPAVLLHY